MSVFQMYLMLGLEHIADFKGFDHILFLTCLMAVYQFKHWKKVLKLITAFTVGHSISLALSVLNWVHFSIPLIEFLIPITILITAVANIINKQELSPKFYIYEYFISLIFGLIHGLGFSVLLKSLLGQEESLVKPLFAFNIGIELGQIIIVCCILSLGYILTKRLKLRISFWGYIVLGICLLAYYINTEPLLFIIVNCILSLIFLAAKYAKIKTIYWSYLLSGISLLVSSYLIIDRWAW